MSTKTRGRTGVVMLLGALVASASCVVGAGVVVPVGPGTSAGLEYGTNRGGMDYNSFDLPSGRPEDCRDACMADSHCAAFTFVNPGVQGPNARCWLKSPVPNPVPDNCCVSGVKPTASPAPVPGGGMLEPATNRNGSDLRNFDLPSATPEICRDACLADPQCMAFTYVNPGVQGSNPRCWLKNPAPPPTPDTCCVSGVK